MRQGLAETLRQSVAAAAAGSARVDGVRPAVTLVVRPRRARAGGREGARQ